MQNSRTPKRFTESFPGTLAAILLAVIWIGSMGAVDSYAYSTAPYLAALCAVVVLWLVGILFRHKMVKLRFLSWCALAAGGYFLWRCHTSYSVVEAWGEAAIILGCFVFYIAGVYAGQGDKCGGVVFTLVLALIANLAMWGMQDSGIPMPFPLRPAHGVCGEAAGYTALFSYKNFAGFFLMTAGSLPLCYKLFRPERGFMAWCAVLVGAAAMAASFLMGTRSVLFLLPALVVSLWILWLVAVLTEVRRAGLIFVLSGICLLVGATIAVYDFLFGYTIVPIIASADSHLRGMAWELVCRIAPGAPLWGFGAKATQWEIAQFFNDWCTPNMAHNEYLQAWMDYGLIGLGLVVSILITHFVAGCRQIAAENITPGRQAKTGMALLYLLGSALYAAADFGWHQAALAAGAAFACGVLASPYPMRPWRLQDIGRNWAPESRPKALPVRAQGWFGKLLLSLLALGLGADMATLCRQLAPAYLASWQYDKITKERPGSFGARRQLMESVHAGYPDYALMDAYIQLPMERPVNWQRIENMFRATLAANPRQAFTGVMLVDLLGRQGRFEEAELLMRRMYDGDGPESTRTTNWGFYYAYNLIRWGQAKMYAGDLGTARSMLEMGFAVAPHNSMLPGTTYRTGYKPWETGETARFRSDIMGAARNDLDMLRKLEVQPDDSWQQPMEQGGKPALYQRWKPAR